QREEVDLVQEIAELVEQLVGPARVRRVRDLVRLLARVRHDRLGRLLAVPGTVAAQAFRQLLQLEERVRERQAARASAWWRRRRWWSQAVRSRPGSSSSTRRPSTCRRPTSASPLASSARGAAA